MSSKMQEKIGLLLKHSQNQQEKKILKAQLNKNLNFFKKVIPQLYEDYKDYQFKSMSLSINDNGHAALLDMNKNSVYPKDAKTFCFEQVEKYYQTPLGLYPHFSIMGGKRFKEGKILDRFRSFINKEINDYAQDIKKPVGLLIINGIGLGYHIPKLIDDLDIFNIAIFDDSKDSFFASLHTTDWQEIISPFKQGGRGVHLSIGNKASDNLSNLACFFQTISDFNRLNVFCYNHLSYDKSMSESLSFSLLADFKKTQAPLGFFEDEQISFAHTYENLKRGVPLLLDKSPPKDLAYPPVMIVGNGPSLDNQITFLKKHAKSSIIFACGSAIASLIKYDITPDFFILCERTFSTFKTTVSYNLSKAHKKNIRLLGLNTIPPDVCSLFKNAYMGAKSSDAGGLYIESQFGHEFALMKNCNPLVGNTAASFAMHLGFSHIVLLGMDFGISDSGKHHSNQSEYYNENNSTLFEKNSYDANYAIKGNFGGTVWAESRLILASKQMTLLAKLNPQITIYNPNYGAYIEGAIPIKLQELESLIPYPQTLDKNKFIQTLCAHYFRKISKKKVPSKSQIQDTLINPMFDYVDSIHLPTHPKSAFEVQTHLENQIVRLRNIGVEQPILENILKGSFANFFPYLLLVALAANSEENLQLTFNNSLSFFNEFIKLSKKILKTSFFELDKEP